MKVGEVAELVGDVFGRMSSVERDNISRLLASTATRPEVKEKMIAAVIRMVKREQSEKEKPKEAFDFAKFIDELIPGFKTR